MTLFQLVSIPLLLIAVLLDTRALLGTHRLVFVVRVLVWIGAILLISFPELTNKLASIFGIGRGSDLVFYTFMLAATVFMFHLYGRNFTLRRDVVELVRREALRTPKHGSEEHT